MNSGSKELPGSLGEHVLQERYGVEKKAQAFYTNQVLRSLNDEMKEFIGKQTMVFIATADAQGECDASFRAGNPGFVQVISEHRLLYPEYRGNRVMASLGNMYENPHVGLFFVDFFDSTIGLHVNGLAHIVETADLSSREDVPERILNNLARKDEPDIERAVLVEVEEAYIHCSKHIPRLERLDKTIEWGTDSEARKGGDYFNVAGSRSRAV